MSPINAEATVISVFKQSIPFGSKAIKNYRKVCSLQQIKPFIDAFAFLLMACCKRFKVVYL